MYTHSLYTQGKSQVYAGRYVEQFVKVVIPNDSKKVTKTLPINYYTAGYNDKVTNSF